jgi:hypothetical protein
VQSLQDSDLVLRVRGGGRLVEQHARGALTTFSTFGFETMRLLEESSILEAGLNALGNSPAS